MNEAVLPITDIADTTAAALQAELDASLAADASLPGIIATVHAPRIGLRWSGASGAMTLGGANAVTPAHALRIASVTKPYTSAVALRLFEQDRLDLFAPISTLLAADTHAMLSAAGYSPAGITPYHLLTHGSGLRDHAGHASPYGDRVMADPSHVWSHAEQVDLCMSLGSPLASPGTLFSYSDTGYLILGDILERVAGRPLHVLMRELLDFNRMGLTQTHFERHEPPPVGQLRAGQFMGKVDVSSFDCSCDLSGGGGLISTTDELAVFFRAAALGELFDRPQTLSLALATPSLSFTPPDALHSPLFRGRAFGREASWAHGGFWGVVALYCPASDVALAVSFNQVLPGETTTGVPGDPGKPSLADRLALIAQRPATTAAGYRP